MKKMSLKAPTGLLSDAVVQLPAEAVENSSGFALDIGSTVGKLIYRSNKEYQAPLAVVSQLSAISERWERWIIVDLCDLIPCEIIQHVEYFRRDPVRLWKRLPAKMIANDCKDDPSKGQVHYAMFYRDDCNGMIMYIQENADLTKNEDGVILVNASGCGGQTNKEVLEAGLNCKIEVLTEFDCFIRSFLTLEKTQTRDELYIPYSDKVIEAGKTIKKDMEERMQQAETMSNLKVREKLGKEVVEDRPRILFMSGSGSGSGSFQMNKDGSSGFVDHAYTAGRFLYGLSAFLAGENDFSKLVEMAERADGRTTGLKMQEVMLEKMEGDEENMYKMDDFDFPFGKGVTQSLDDVKKEDLVHNTFQMVAMNHASSILTSCRLTGATEVVMCGNVFNSAIMRDMTLRNKMLLESFLMPMKAEVEVNFVKNGGCMGALGAYLFVKEA